MRILRITSFLYPISKGGIGLYVKQITEALSQSDDIFQKVIIISDRKSEIYAKKNIQYEFMNRRISLFGNRLFF